MSDVGDELGGEGAPNLQVVREHAWCGHDPRLVVRDVIAVRDRDRQDPSGSGCRTGEADDQ